MLCVEVKMCADEEKGSWIRPEERLVFMVFPWLSSEQETDTEDE